MSEMLVIDADSINSEYALKVDTKHSQPVPTVILSFPNSTTVTIRGDEKVVKQVVERLDGIVVEYEDPIKYLGENI